MKKLVLLTLMLLSFALAFSQSKMACCAKPSSTQQFAMLASDKKFVMAHANPKPYHFQSSIGKAITNNCGTKNIRTIASMPTGGEDEQLTQN